MNRVQRGDWDQWWRSAAIYQIYPILVLIPAVMGSAIWPGC